jgi:hypothetical protein
MLLAMIVTGVSIQTSRYIVHERKVRKERAELEAKIDQTIAKNHNRPPLCGVLFLGNLERDVEKSPVYQNMPARERNRLSSKIEAERFHHYDRGDQQAVLKTKKPFVKVEDRYR